MWSANDVASVVLARSGVWMDAIRLQKILYYVQAWHLAVTGEPLFHEQIKAWKKGPVVPQVWHSRRSGVSRSPSFQDLDEVQIDELTSDLIDLVLRSYGSMSAQELSALTHVEQPWITARGDLPDDAPCSTPISLDEMASFYRAHRMLGGRRAADLAAGGVHIRDPKVAGPVDVAEILASLPEEFNDPGDDPWGGANLDTGEQFDSEGIVRARSRAHMDS